MVDPGTGLAVLGSAPIVVKILGPTADYVGSGLQHWTEQQVENVQRVFRKAEGKLGPEGLDRPGAVPPRVLKEILGEGAFCDDELGAEYLGGVLAASKSEVPRDDRGAALASLVGRLSTYQLRTHYVMYAVARSWFVKGTPSMDVFNLGIPKDQKQYGRFFVPQSDWTRAMDFSTEETRDEMGILAHVVSGLDREGLIGAYATGPGDHLRTLLPKHDFPEGGGILFQVSLLGIELFMVAHGYRGIAAPKRAIQDGDLETGIDQAVDLGSGSQWLLSASDDQQPPAGSPE
jgi:hypothetical protein